MVHGGDLNLGHLDEARDILIKEYIYDHHNYKGGLSTCILNGLELPLEDVSNESMHIVMIIKNICGLWWGPEPFST